MSYSNFGYPQPYNPVYFQPQTYTGQYFPNNQTVMQSQPQSDEVLGKIVDSVDVVRSVNADLNGRPYYFPKVDGTEIYCKRINPQTGASMIQTYALVNEGNSQSQDTQFSSALSQLQKELSGEISDLKNIVMDYLTSPSKVNVPKGGVK